MPTGKTETLTFRLREETKALLRQAAEREQRSMANMLEIMIREWPGLSAREACPARSDERLN